MTLKELQTARGDHAPYSEERLAELVSIPPALRHAEPSREAGAGPTRADGRDATDLPQALEERLAERDAGPGFSKPDPALENADRAANDIAGSGGLRKLGTGTLALTGANTYTGRTTVEQGTLEVQRAMPGGATVLSGGRLRLSAGLQGNPVAANVGSLDNTGTIEFLGGATSQGATYTMSSLAIRTLRAGSPSLRSFLKLTRYCSVLPSGVLRMTVTI